MLLLSSADFSKWTFSQNYFRNTIRVSNGLDLDQDRHFFSPDLGLNYLQKLTADDKKSPLTRKELKFRKFWMLKKTTECRSWSGSELFVKGYQQMTKVASSASKKRVNKLIHTDSDLYKNEIPILNSNNTVVYLTQVNEGNSISFIYTIGFYRCFGIHSVISLLFT